MRSSGCRSRSPAEAIIPWRSRARGERARIADSVSNDELKWRARVREGEALRALARLDEAQQSFEDAIAVIRSLATNAATSAATRSQLDESATAWSGLALTLAQRGDAAGGLVAEEQRRAYLRQLALASFESDIVRGSSPADQDQERQTMRELISARAQLRAELSAKNPDAERLQQLQQRVTALGKTRADQQAALYTRVPDLALWRGQQPLPEARDLEELVPAGTLTIELVMTDDQLLVFSAAHGDAALDVAAAIIPIKREEVEAVVARALEPEALRDPTVWRTQVRALARPPDQTARDPSPGSRSHRPVAGRCSVESAVRGARGRRGRPRVPREPHLRDVADRPRHAAPQHRPARPWGQTPIGCR